MRRKSLDRIAGWTAVLFVACSDQTPAENADSGSDGSAISRGTDSGSSRGVDGGGGDSSSTSGGSGDSGGDAGGPDVDAAGAPIEGGAIAGGDAADGQADGSQRFSCPAGPFPPPIAGTSQTVCGSFPFKYNLHDGPTWVASSQAFFFSNFVRGAAGPGDIIKYTPGGSCETWLAGAGCNGLTAAHDGALVAACQTPRAVVAYDIVTKTPKTLASMYMGQMLDSPNDIVAHSSGTIFFTNPTYELGGRPAGIGPAIFYIDGAGILNRVAGTVGLQPNGIALSPDEKHLYVEEDSSGVKVYDLDPKGVPSAGPRNFTRTTDGISVDCAGNLYLSGGAIISPAGTQVGSFPGGGTMAAFGGPDGKTLIVVGGGSGTAVQTVQMNIPGPPH